MDNESFYLTVNSNTPNPTGGTNKTQQFTVKTLVDQALNGEWEVGLMNLRYPNSWYNIPTSLILTYYYTKQLSSLTLEEWRKTKMAEYLARRSGTPQTNISPIPDTDQTKSMLVSIVIPAGNYETLEDLLKIINKKQETLLFSYDVITKRVSIAQSQDPALKDFQIKVGKTQTLMNMLGFVNQEESAHLKLNGDIVTATHEASVSLHFPAIYIYSDVVKHQYVNGMMAQLLFDDTITGESGKYTERRIGPKDAMYLTVGKKYISQLEFEIRDDTGELIPFQAGKVQIRLHFRPKLI